MYQLPDKEPQEPLYGVPSWEALRQKAYDLLRQRFAYGWPESDWHDMAHNAILKVIKALDLACADATVLDALGAACKDATVLQALRKAGLDATILDALAQCGQAPTAEVLCLVIPAVPRDGFWQALPAEVLLTAIRVLIKQPRADEAHTMAGFYGLFARVVAQTAITYWRAQYGKKGGRTYVEWTETDAAEDTRQTEELRQMAMRHDLGKALDTLPKRLREVMKYTYWYDLQSPAIADITGGNHHTIRTQRAQALAILRTYFEKG